MTTRFFTQLIFTITFSAFACTNPEAVSSAPDATSSSQAPLETQEEGSAAVVNLGVPLRLLREAMQDVTLQPDQQAHVVQLESEARARHAPLRKATSEFFMALADQVDHGAINSPNCNRNAKLLRRSGQ